MAEVLLSLPCVREEYRTSAYLPEGRAARRFGWRARGRRRRRGTREISWADNLLYDSARFGFRRAAAVAVDLGIAPLGVGGEEDAGVSSLGVDAPGDVSLAVELILSGAGEDHAVGGIAGDGVGGGRGERGGGGGRGGRAGGGGRGGLGRLAWGPGFGVAGGRLRTTTAPLFKARVLALWVSQTRPMIKTTTIMRIVKICFMPSPCAGESGPAHGLYPTILKPGDCAVEAKAA